MTLRVLLFGATGQVGRAVSRVAGDGVRVTPLDRRLADFLDPAACAARVLEADVDVVANAAAFTDVSAAERDPARAWRINAVAPGVIARAAAARGLPFVHLSSNAVFGGATPEPLDEDAPTAPLQVYGRTKLAGERAVLAAGGRAAVLRLSWVFSDTGRNFVTKVLAAADAGGVQGVVDSRANPTDADDVGAAVLAVARSGVAAPGVFHFAGAPDASPYEVVAEALRAAGVAHAPTPISHADWPVSPPLPQFTRLDCSRIAQAYGVQQPDWRRAIARAVRRARERNDGHETRNHHGGGLRDAAVPDHAGGLKAAAARL